MIRRMLALVGGLAVAAAALGCEGSVAGGDVTQGPEVEELRGLVVNMLVAAAKDDFASVRQHLDAKGYLGAMQSDQAFQYDKLTKDEQAEHARSCFNQLKAVGGQSTLRDATALQAALANARITIHRRVGRAEVDFEGPDEKGKPVKFAMKLGRARDGPWRLITCTPEFTR